MSESASIIRPSKSLLMDRTASAFQALDHECTLFTKYVIGQEPGDYVLLKYRQAHTVGDMVCLSEGSQWDRFLLTVSTKHPIVIKFVDSYTSFFCRKALVRRKWILLLAILESCAPTYNTFESPDTSDRNRVLLSLFWKGMGFLLTLSLSMVFFMPLQVVLATHARLFAALDHDG